MRQQRQYYRLAVAMVAVGMYAWKEMGVVNARSACHQRHISGMPFGSFRHPSLVFMRGGATEEEGAMTESQPLSSSKKTRKKKSKRTSAATPNVPSASSTTVTKKSLEGSAASGMATSSTTASLKSKKKTSNKMATPSHAFKDLKSSSPNYRIQRELKAFLADPPPNLSVRVGKNIRVWIVTLQGAAGSIYEGEVFRLRIAFPPQYPTVPPSVYFLGPNIPLHEHVYTNGDICLSLLGKDWRPTMTAQSIAVSIMSILSSALSKSLPMDNAQHAGNKPGQYQKDWVYHDDNC